MTHLKLAFRQILLRPALSALVVVMLAVGIGSTTAVYSLFHQVLIEPLPADSPEQLVNLSSPGFKPGSTWGSESVGDGDSLASASGPFLWPFLWAARSGIRANGCVSKPRCD
jgi:hypothetical protein